MWNLKNKTNEQNRNRLIDTENKLMIARRMGFGETDEIQEEWISWILMEEIKRYKFPAVK